LKFIRRVQKLPFVECVYLKLESEPGNPHDPDAIKVLLEYEDEAFFHLGYLPNANTICGDGFGGCGWTGERYPVTDRCPDCKTGEFLARCGTATRLKGMLKEHICGDQAYALVEEITGGDENKNYGANISIWIEED
jgi:hypothetical protein